MGLDQYANVRDKQSGQVKAPDYEKVYSDKYEPTQHGFVWRKHSRLQQFMSDIWGNNNPDSDPMNGDDELVITKDIIKQLRKEVDSNYHSSFCHGGFFWGHQFQEEAVKEYADLDKQFCDWADKELDNGNEVIYSCSW